MGGGGWGTKSKSTRWECSSWHLYEVYHELKFVAIKCRRRLSVVAVNYEATQGERRMSSKTVDIFSYI